MNGSLLRKVTKFSKGAILEKHGLILQEKKKKKKKAKPENFKTNSCKTEGYFPKAFSLKTSKCIKRGY